MSKVRYWVGSAGPFFFNSGGTYKDGTPHQVLRVEVSGSSSEVLDGGDFITLSGKTLRVQRSGLGFTVQLLDGATSEVYGVFAPSGLAYSNLVGQGLTLSCSTNTMGLQLTNATGDALFSASLAAGHLTLQIDGLTTVDQADGKTIYNDAGTLKVSS